MSAPSRVARRQVLLDQARAFDGDAFGHRMVAGRAIGFEAMRQRVHARRRRQIGRQADRQLGIADRDRRHHLRMEDDLLGVGRLLRDDAGAADLGAGAGGGRHGDDRRDAVRIGARPPVADVLEVPHRPRLAGHEGDDLADVERRAAAERDDAVVAAGAEDGDAGGDVAFDRIGLDVGKHVRRPGRRRASASSACATAGNLATPGSVTSSGRDAPTLFSASGSSAMRPAPKRMAVG